MPIKIKPAPKASSNSNVMVQILHLLLYAAIVGMLAACGSVPRQSPAELPAIAVPQSTSKSLLSAPPEGVVAIQQARSRWIPVAWSELPGFEDDALFEAWNAWIKSCERPHASHAVLCPQVRRLSIGNADEQRSWMQERLQPFRVESLQGQTEGLLTGYFEPLLEARRLPDEVFNVPLYQLPVGMPQRKPWYSRQEMDTLPQAQAALKDRVIGYLQDPVDALVLQIQGSGRVHLTEPDGSQRWLRMAFAGTNEQPYRSVGRWLLDQGLVKDASWPGIKAWLAQNPERRQELLWANPRVVFFKPEALTDLDSGFGPRGAQGVALTPGRSIAVDPGSVPYGTPVWITSNGAQIPLQKLVLAQDTGSAITGAVRADYFAGWGDAAADLAGRLRQPMQMWVLWPK